MKGLRTLRTVSRVSEEGFTLLELLVVLVILALLATIATPQVMKYMRGAKVDTTKIQIDALSTAMELYYLDVGHYPTAEEGLKALLEKPETEVAWSGPYVKRNAALLDPWGTPYKYHAGDHGDFEIKSFGSDKAEGGTGDAADLSNSR